MHKKRRKLLKHAIKTNGIVTARKARRLYSSPNQAQEAIQSLQEQGFLKQKSPGVWKIQIQQVPNNVIKTAKQEMKQ